MATVVSKTIRGYGPYFYHVEWRGGKQYWEYLGKVDEVDVHDRIEDEDLTPVEDEDVPSTVGGDETELRVAEEVLGEIDGDELRTKMTVDVDEDGNLTVESNKGNKSLLGIADGLDDENLDLSIVAYQQPKTTERASGEAELEEGDIVKAKKWSHSGKTSSESFAIYDGEQLVEIGKQDAQEIEYRRHNDLPENSAFARNDDEFGVDPSGDGWIQRVNDYDPDEYTYNWDSEFVNSAVATYDEGEVVRTSRDDFYVVGEGELVEIGEEEAKERL